MSPITTTKATNGVAAPPTGLDVIFGRGRPIQQLEGNLRFREIVGSHDKIYKSATKAEKTRISKLIIQIITKKGGRFLKLNDTTGLYEEVGDTCARNKVSHALRTRRKSITTKENKSNKPPCPKFVVVKNEVRFDGLLRMQQQILGGLLESVSSSPVDVMDFGESNENERMDRVVSSLDDDFFQSQSPILFDPALEDMDSPSDGLQMFSNELQSIVASRML